MEHNPPPAIPFSEYVFYFADLASRQDWQAINDTIEKFYYWGRTWRASLVLYAIAEDLEAGTELAGVTRAQMADNFSENALLKIFESACLLTSILKELDTDEKWINV